MGKIRRVEIAGYAASKSDGAYEQDLYLSFFLFLFPQRTCSQAKSVVENNKK